MVVEDRAAGSSFSRWNDLVREANELIEISRQAIGAARAARERTALLREVQRRSRESDEGLWEADLPSLPPQREPQAAEPEAAPDTPRPSP